MQKLKKYIKEYIKRTNGLAILSFLLAIFAWFWDFFSGICNNIPSMLAFYAALIGIIALVWLKIKKQKGESLAILGIVLGLLGVILLTTIC